MKGGVAMMLAAFLQAAEADTPPPGDVVLCLLSDEEAGATTARARLERLLTRGARRLRATTSRGYGA
jgi:acetylornithine deacetylase/succinyl-diaminopimelate desuccinylase-like protein